MLKPIKTFYVKGIPNLIDWEEAVNITKEESCVVELRWMPNIMTGYYHEYVFEDSDPVKIDEKTPKIYGR